MADAAIISNEDTNSLELYESLGDTLIDIGEGQTLVLGPGVEEEYPDLVAETIAGNADSWYELADAGEAPEDRLYTEELEDEEEEEELEDED
jgi:hypothetical protein